MILTSMVGFIELIEKEVCPRSVELENELKIKQWWKMIKYKDFLSQPLTIGMFVPCDLEGNVLDEPCSEIEEIYEMMLSKYQQAKDRVLFVEGEFGFGFKENTGREKGVFQILLSSYPTIESFVDYDQTTLTATALKQIGL